MMPSEGWAGLGAAVTGALALLARWAERRRNGNGRSRGMEVRLCAEDRLRLDNIHEALHDLRKDIAAMWRDILRGER